MSEPSRRWPAALALLPAALFTPLLSRRAAAAARPAGPGLLAACLVVGVSVGGQTARAAPPQSPVIPPGRETAIREVVESSLSPSAGAVSIQIERDRVRIRPEASDSLRLVVLPPGAGVDEIGDVVAPGVIVQCGDQTSRRCAADEVEHWTPAARDLATARDRRADDIWVSAGPTTADTAPGAGAPASLPERDPARSRLLASLALLFGIIAAVGNGGRPRRRWLWPIASVAVLVGACWLFSPLLPLHEHNSFLARADCAADLRCPDDPAGRVWSTVTLDVLGLFFGLFPARIFSYGAVSLLWSAMTVLFVHAFTNRLTVQLGLSRWSTAAATFASALLATHPLFWRLSTGGIFWPYASACALAAGYFGLACAQAQRDWIRVANAVAASLALALACASNTLLLVLAPLVLLAPACWARWRGARAMMRSGALVLPGMLVFFWALAPPVRVGIERVLGAADDPVSQYSVSSVWGNLAWVFAEPRLSPVVLAVPMLLSLGLLASWARLRQCLPPLYAGLVPFSLLCVHAGDLFGATYPVQFINHFWSMPFSAVAAGLGLAWGLERLARGRRLDRRRVAFAATAFVLLTVGTWPLAGETSRLLGERRAIERELLEIERAIAELPEHDILLLPRLPLEPLPSAGRQGDPIEVHYPQRIHQAMMRERGLVAPRVIHIDELAEYGRDHRALLYVGSPLRSFQPHEIQGGLVPDSLERPELTALREHYDLEPVIEFEVAAAQHELVWTRLGADRLPTVTLGYYFLRPRSEDDASVSGTGRR